MKYVCSVAYRTNNKAARSVLEFVNSIAGEWRARLAGEDFGLVSMARSGAVLGSEERLLVWHIGPSPVSKQLAEGFEWLGIYCLKDVDEHQCKAWAMLIEEEARNSGLLCSR